MTNVNKLVSDLISDIEAIATSVVNDIKSGTTPKESAKEEPTVPEAPTDEKEDFDPFNIFVGDVDPAWEAVEVLQKAESAADKGDNEAAAAYLGIADRYIKLADIFAETEIHVTEETTVSL